MMTSVKFWASDLYDALRVSGFGYCDATASCTCCFLEVQNRSGHIKLNCSFRSVVAPLCKGEYKTSSPLL